MPPERATAGSLRQQAGSADGRTFQPADRFGWRQDPSGSRPVWLTAGHFSRQTGSAGGRMHPAADWFSLRDIPADGST
ncbi:MAG TPA: hypothetical protein DEP67_08145 [Lachnospiraceae bacterium]|nr:hypothetical protein [Lachnospiraceae bacterium]